MLTQQAAMQQCSIVVREQLHSGERCFGYLRLLYLCESSSTTESVLLRVTPFRPFRDCVPLLGAAVLWQSRGHRYGDRQPERHAAHNDPLSHVRAQPGGFVRRSAASVLAAKMPQYGGALVGRLAVACPLQACVSCSMWVFCVDGAIKY